MPSLFPIMCGVSFVAQMKRTSESGCCSSCAHFFLTNNLPGPLPPAAPLPVGWSLQAPGGGSSRPSSCASAATRQALRGSHPARHAPSAESHPEAAADEVRKKTSFCAWRGCGGCLDREVKTFRDTGQFRGSCPARPVVHLLFFPELSLEKNA